MWWTFMPRSDSSFEPSRGSPCFRPKLGDDYQDVPVPGAAGLCTDKASREAEARPVYPGAIDAILAGDVMAPPKQRHTAKRIFERLTAPTDFSRQPLLILLLLTKGSSTVSKPHPSRLGRLLEAEYLVNSMSLNVKARAKLSFL